ncbi:MAG: hypothetical protein K8T20_15915 [Planctomycetes bacterium]|nr:hypothetical protein [Planctomycetota bacterium]
MKTSPESRRCACGALPDPSHDFCISCGARQVAPIPDITLRRQLEPFQVVALLVLLVPVCVPIPRDLLGIGAATCLVISFPLFIASQFRIWRSRKIIETVLASARNGSAVRGTLTLLEPFPVRLRSQEASGLAVVGCGLGVVATAMGLAFIIFLLVFVSALLRGCAPH